MLLNFRNLTIRNATVDDANLLSTWWKDGTIMAHAGFPNGINQTAESIADSIKNDSDDTRRRLIIEIDKIPVGEMNYTNKGKNIAEIGIKICDLSNQDKGFGKIFLSMLISSLFNDLKYKKIILDTNLNNKRAQHVYEELGFRQIRVNIDSWENQLGELQSSVDYELYQENFVDFSNKTVTVE